MVAYLNSNPLKATSYSQFYPLTLFVLGVWALSTILGTLPVTGISDYEFIPSTSMCGLRTAIKNTTSNVSYTGLTADR